MAVSVKSAMFCSLLERRLDGVPLYAFDWNERIFDALCPVRSAVPAAPVIMDDASVAVWIATWPSSCDEMVTFLDNAFLQGTAWARAELGSRRAIELLFLYARLECSPRVYTVLYPCMLWAVRDIRRPLSVVVTEWREYACDQVSLGDRMLVAQAMTTGHAPSDAIMRDVCVRVDDMYTWMAWMRHATSTETQQYIRRNACRLSYAFLEDACAHEDEDALWSIAAHTNHAMSSNFLLTLLLGVQQCTGEAFNIVCVEEALETLPWYAIHPDF